MPPAVHSVVLKPVNLQLALGSIDPAARLQSGEILPEALDSFLASLSHYHTAIAAQGDSVPSQCVDGRSRIDGSYTPEAKAAGGTFSAVVGDALTNGSHRPAGADAAAHATAIYTYFVKHGYKIGGHDADHAAEGCCGCGAEDNLMRILAFIQDNGDAIRVFLHSVGVDTDDNTHNLIMKRAASLLSEEYVVTGVDLRDVFVSVAGAGCLETLSGPHHEVVLIINTENGLTIDRAKLAEEYGDRFQAFELDVPSLQTAANALSLTPAEAQQKLTAMLYYNVATAAVLAGPSLRVAVR